MDGKFLSNYVCFYYQTEGGPRNPSSSNATSWKWWHTFFAETWRWVSIPSHMKKTRIYRFMSKQYRSTEGCSKLKVRKHDKFRRKRLRVLAMIKFRRKRLRVLALIVATFPTKAGVFTLAANRYILEIRLKWKTFAWAAVKASTCSVSKLISTAMKPKYA